MELEVSFGWKLTEDTYDGGTWQAKKWVGRIQEVVRENGSIDCVVLTIEYSIILDQY